MAAFVLFALTMFATAIWLSYRERSGKPPLVVWRLPRKPDPNLDQVCEFLEGLYGNEDLIERLKKEFPNGTG